MSRRIFLEPNLQMSGTGIMLTDSCCMWSHEVKECNMYDFRFEGMNYLAWEEERNMHGL